MLPKHMPILACQALVYHWNTPAWNTPACTGQLDRFCLKSTQCTYKYTNSKITQFRGSVTARCRFFSVPIIMISMVEGRSC